MKLFGDLPAPAWFASEVLSLLAAGEPKITLNKDEDLSALQTFIFRQAAKFSLSPEDLQLDLQRCGVSSTVAQQLSAEYAVQKDGLREGLLTAGSFPAIHARVVDTRFGNDDDRGEIQLTLSHGGSVAFRMNSRSTIAVAEALEQAVEALESIK